MSEGLKTLRPLETSDSSSPEVGIKSLRPVRINQNPYHGLSADDTAKRSKAVYDIATDYQRPFAEIEELTADIDEINIHQILNQPAPEMVLENNPSNRFGLTAGLKTGTKTRPRTQDETIKYNAQRLPDDDRTKFMAKEYIRQRALAKKAKDEKQVELKDVYDINMILAYFGGGGEDAAEAIGKANIFRNKPNAFGVGGDTIEYLVDDPSASYVTSAWDTSLDGDRADEIDKLVGFGDAKERDKYYKSKGIIDTAEFHDRKDTREYMPFTIIKAMKGSEIRDAINRLQDPEASYAKSKFTSHGLSPDYDRDLLLMRNHFFNMEESMARGQTFAASLSNLGLNAAKYMTEIALLSGVTTQLAGGKAIGLRSAAKLHKIGVPRLIAANAGKLSSATASALLNPSMQADLTIARMTDKGYAGDIGEFIKTDEGQSLIQALPKSIAEGAVTYYIETLGDDLVKGVFNVGGGVLKIVPKQIVGKIDEIASYMKRTGLRSFDKLPPKLKGSLAAIKKQMNRLLKAGKFDGIFGEMTEEYVDKVVKPILRLDDQYRDKDDDYLTGVAKSMIPNKDELLLQSALFTIIPFSAGAISSVPTTINWAGGKVAKAVEGQAPLPEVKSRIDLENSIAKEYNFDRQTSFEVADMLDRRTNIDKIEKEIQKKGGDLANFRFKDHNNIKALAAMMVDRGILSTDALRIAEIVTQTAGEQDATIQEVVNTKEFRDEVNKAEKEPDAPVEAETEDKGKKALDVAQKLSDQTGKPVWVQDSKVLVKKPEGESTEITPEQAQGEVGEVVEQGKEGPVVYRKAGKVVDGLEVLDDVPNRDSIEATYGSEFEEVSGVQEVSLSENFGDLETGSIEGLKKTATVGQDKRANELVEEITKSGKIKPLILVQDSDGLSVLEGSNRITALARMGKKSIPAIIVKDTESLAQAQEAKPEDAPFKATEETKPRGVSKSVKTEAIKKGLVDSFQDIPDYQIVSLDEQGQLAADLIINDYDRAVKVAMGQEAAPPGVIPEMVYIAVANKATREGDVDTLTELALNSELIKKATVMGQRIRAYGELGEHSAVKAIQKIRQAREEQLSENEKATIKKLRKELATSEKALAKAEKKLGERETNSLVENITKGEEPVIKAKTYGARNKVVTKDKADAAIKRLGDTSKLFAGIDPKKMIDIVEVSVYHLEAIGRNLPAWKDAMIKQFGEKVKPHLTDLWKKATAKLAEANISTTLGKIRVGVDAGKDITAFSYQINKLAKALIMQGANTRTKLVDSAHTELQDIFPDITKREVSDAISGYGKFIRLSTEEIDEVLRDLKGQLQQLSKLEDMAAGIAPVKTGVERRTPSDKERALIKQVGEAKKKGGFEVTDPAKQLKSALGAIKTRLKNSIADIEKQIADKKKTVKTKRPTPTDAEVEALRIKKDALKSLFDEMFGKAKMTMAQRIAAAKSRLQTDINKLNKRIEKGDFAKEQREAIPEDAKLKKLREEKGTAKRAVDAAREVLKQGGGIAKAEVETIMRLSQGIESTKLAMEASPRRTQYGRPTETEMQYGLAVVAFENYVETIQLKTAKKAIPQRLKSWLSPIQVLTDIAGTAKSIRASMDNSFIGRQGIKLFYLGITGNFKAGDIWLKTFFKSFKVMAGSLVGKPVMDIVRAEILSDPQYDMMRRAKVATAVAEEEFPVHWPSQIPIIGRAFKASEDAFTASAYYMRYRTAKMYFDIAQKTGVDLNDKFQLESIGLLVNSLTARGKVGSYGGKPGFVNSVLWSPKMLASNFDVFLLQPFNFSDSIGLANPSFSKFAQRQALRNLLQIILGQAAILFIANKIFPGSVEVEPGKSDTGKIRIGNTRFDISGGSGSMITLALRIANGTFTSSSGRQLELDSGSYGGMSSMDLVWSFLENKLAPAASTATKIPLLIHGKKDWRTGKKITPLTMAGDLFVPLPFETLKELMEDPESADILAAMIAESLGVSAQNYKIRGSGGIR